MLRPMIVAPMPDSPAAMNSSSTPVDPPVIPKFRRMVAVAKAQVCSFSPPTPSGCSSVWPGPAMYPSSDIATLCTRSFGNGAQPAVK
jgi:hypothetical protein